MFVVWAEVLTEGCFEALVFVVVCFEKFDKVQCIYWLESSVFEGFKSFEVFCLVLGDELMGSIVHELD